MDFLIKNTKGLTLKTKGKYCTEDLVINIDTSLVEGYIEVDELPEVGLPRVLYKVMLEEPEYYIWENDEWLQLNTKGGLIEVSELPEFGEENTVYKLVSKGGTVVPNSGYVEKVYINISLSVEETDTILSQLTYTQTQLHSKPISGLLLTESGKAWMAIKFDDGYQMLIYDLTTSGYIIFYTSTTATGTDYEGWVLNNADTNYEPIKENVISDYNGLGVGAENDKIINLISTTPFETKEEYYIYESGAWVKISGVNIVSKGGTAVPNSGYVEKVYFNTSLSKDEYYNILNNITFTDGSALGLSGISFYAAMAYMNNSSPYVLGFMKYAEDNIHFGLINFSSMLTIQNFFMDEWEVFDNPYSINNEVLSTLSGLPIGTENDKLINLISTTPFENKVIKELNGNYEAVELEVTENTTVDVGAMLDEGKMPMSVTVNVGGESINVMKTLLDGRKLANNLFQSYSGESVDDLISYSDTENVTDTTMMFAGCANLIKAPLLNTSNVKKSQQMFNSCMKLQTVLSLDMIKVTSASNMFNFCTALTNLTLLNIKVDLIIGSGTTWGHLLTLESLINTIKECINVGSAKTLTMGTANLEKIANTYVKFTDSSVTSIPTNEKGDVVVCESTDEGAMLLSDYALLKNWTLA